MQNLNIISYGYTLFHRQGNPRGKWEGVQLGNSLPFHPHAGRIAGFPWHDICSIDARQSIFGAKNSLAGLS